MPVCLETQPNWQVTDFLLNPPDGGFGQAWALTTPPVRQETLPKGSGGPKIVRKEVSVLAQALSHLVP